MTSATDALRRLLDERGVGWTTASGSACYTAWATERGIAQAADYGEDGGVLSVLFRCVPAQAVEATLGRGTCHAVFEVDAMSEDDRIGEFVCSECGETFGDGRDQLPHYCPSCGRKVVE